LRRAYDKKAQYFGIMSMDSINAPQMIEHLCKSLNFTPHEVRWIPCSARFICTGISPSSKGVLNMFELSKGGLNTVLDCKNMCDHGVKCATFGASGVEQRHLAIGDYGGCLSIHDLHRFSNDGGNNSGRSDIFSVRTAHSSIINAIDGIGGGSIGHGAPELVTGGRDGCVRVWDPRVNHAVVHLEPKQNTSARDCWTVAFGDSYNDEERCVCAGYDNGDVKVFDLRTNSLRWETNCRNGVTSIQFDRPDIEMNKMVVTTLESKFHCYDLRTQHAEDGFTCHTERAHRSTIWFGRHLPQNRDIFMTGGGNGGLNIYKYHYPGNRVGKHRQDGNPIGIPGTVELLNSRVISTQPIGSFDWSPDREGLCCMSCLDQTIR